MMSCQKSSVKSTATDQSKVAPLLQETAMSAAGKERPSIVITGASSGLGRAMALHFVAEVISKLNVEKSSSGEFIRNRTAEQKCMR